MSGSPTVAAKEQLIKLYKQGLHPAPDASGGGSRELQDLFMDLVKWDTVMSGLVSSFLSGPGKISRSDLVPTARSRLDQIDDRFKQFVPQNEREEAYSKRYKKWITSLLRMADLLEKCLAENED